jgi:hypothetical protein
LLCDKCFQALPTTDKPKHPAQETKVKDSLIPDDKPVKTPDLESVKEDIKVKDGSPVAEDRADLNLLGPENDEEQNDMLSDKKPEQENDATMPVDDNEAGGKKKKRKHRSRRGKGAAATRWSPRNKQKTEGTTGSEGTEDLKGVAKELFTSPERKKTTSPENVSTEKRKKLDLEKGSRDLEESIPRKKVKVDDPLSRIDPSPPLVEEGSRDLEESIPCKKAKVDDPLSRIDPSPPLVESACLPGAPEPKTITESNHSQKQQAGKSKAGDLASCVVEFGKEDDDLKPSAENKNMERGSDLKILEDESTDTDTASDSDTGYTAKPKKRSPEKSNKEDPPKETDLDTILYAPVKNGRPQNQKDITDFFLRELVLRKKKLEDSSSRRREKGADWYSKLRKTPEQSTEEKIRLRRVCAENNLAKEKRKHLAREAKECVQRRKEAAKKAEEEETQQEQDRNDRAIALRLFKKNYKDEFDKRGRSVARHRQGKLEKQLEQNFEHTNKLDEDEAKEWVALVEDAKKGDKEKKKIMDDNNCVKELKVYAMSQHSGYLVLNRRKTRCGHVSRYLNGKGLW